MLVIRDENGEVRRFACEFDLKSNSRHRRPNIAQCAIVEITGPGHVVDGLVEGRKMVENSTEAFDIV